VWQFDLRSSLPLAAARFCPISLRKFIDLT
jgi:hypothetical protein